MWDSFRLSPNNLTTSAARRRILNPSFTQCRISPRINAVILGVHAGAWVPFGMACSKERCVQDSIVCTGMPLYTYLQSRVSAGCRNDVVRATRVTRRLEEMKAVRKGACASTSAVSHVMSTRLLPLISTGRG